jgi:two-component system OmpR family sensor kinase
MTLRTRLLLFLVGLTAVGLAIAGVVTYNRTRTTLVDQVDEQLTSALRTPQLFFNSPSRFGDRGPGPDILLPPGTYAELRGADGDVIDTQLVGFADSPAPSLPDDVPDGTFTVSSPHYRALAQPVAFGPPDQRQRGLLIAAVPLHDVDRTLHRLFITELLVAVAVLCALAVAAWWVVRIGLRPLERMGATAGKIAAGDLSQRVEPATEATEVGRLGLALNSMLGQIEQAFAEREASEARLRRFVADASHELRTPLTSIRGYAELFRRGAQERPEDLAKTMRRIEEAAARMGILVDDLLLLARLDQGRPLEHTPVDLDRLAAEAVDDAQATAPDHPISYTPNGQITVVGDEMRLRQALGNLLTNACTHTPPRTPVHVSITRDGTDAVIEVADEGPGMDDDDAGHAFERFWRADASRTRESGGAGLGLSIVAAIAQAHGGSASVDTAPGQGARFRVRLPTGS